MLEKDLWRKLKTAFKNEPSLELRRIENTIGIGLPDVLFTHEINGFMYHGFIELKVAHKKWIGNPTELQLLLNILSATQYKWFIAQPNSWVLLINEFKNVKRAFFYNKYDRGPARIDIDEIKNYIICKLCWHYEHFTMKICHKP